MTQSLPYISLKKSDGKEISMNINSSGFPEARTGFDEVFGFYQSAFELALENESSRLTNKSAGYINVCEAMKYSLKAGGKRIRPMLALEFCRACGGNINDAMPAAVAIEMIHTFSLIHDDLPCMDDDDLRRGKPSCHKAYGEAVALLAGDALTLIACGIIADSGISPQKSSKMISVLCDCGYKMIGGQTIDIEGNPESIDRLYEMYALKTSELIRAACVMGCIAAGADEEKLRAANEYAYNLGLAFQIIDDILDVTSDEATLGKPIGSDEKQCKLTSIGFVGLEKAKCDAAEFTAKAESNLGAFEHNEFLLKMTDMLLQRKK